MAKLLYRVGLRRAHTVFFQNQEDRDLFVEAGLANRQRALLLPGSGIDLSQFPVAPAPSAPEDHVVFLLVARLVRDKGVYEFVEAARRLKTIEPRARCRIVGFLDVANRTAISRSEMEAWIAEGAVDYLGQTDDVRPHIAAANCVVLPSYREGTSRVLLEGAAMARPLIASDVAGCRELIDDGVTGLLCPVRDATALAAAMVQLVALDRDAREAMGRAGRAKVAREFDEALVIARYLERLADAQHPGGYSTRI